MGVNVDAVNSAAFAIAAVPGGISGLFVGRKLVEAEPLTGTFIAPSRALCVPAAAVAALAVAASALPFVYSSPYLLQTLTNAWLARLLALSLALVAGTAGQVSFGHAGLVAICGYASALLATDYGVTPLATIPLAGVPTSLLGTALVFPAFRLRGHYIAIATLAIGEIVSLVILNWESFTHGALGVAGISPLSAFGYEATSALAIYWLTLAALIAFALLQARLACSHIGRTLRTLREDEIAARSHGVNVTRYKVLAFGFGAGVSGAISAHLFSYLNNQTFDSQLSLLAVTMAILGGMGNVLGAIVGAVAPVGLPEAFRFAAECRVLIYGLVLLALVRFRPQGLLGTA